MSYRQKKLWFERLFGIEEDFKTVHKDLECVKGEDLECTKTVNEDLACVDTVNEGLECIKTVNEDLTCVETVNEDLTCVETVNEDLACVDTVNEDLECIKTVNEDLTCVETVNEDLECINTVNEDLECIKTVNEDLACVDTVNEDLACVDTVNEDLECIKTVNEDLTCVETVNEDLTCVETVNEDLACVDTVNEDLECIKTVNEDLTCVETVNEDLECINTVNEDLECTKTVNEDLTCVDTVNEDLTCVETVNEDLTCVDTVNEDLASVKGDGDCLFYISGPNKKRYCAGTFEHVSVEDLQSRNPPEGDEKTIMKVVAGDVVNLINDRANNGAVFQVASQFNCLEFVNPAITPEAGVDRYEYDHTQGPACSIACGAATVYRNYFVDMPTSAKFPNVQVGQSSDRQLDGFEDITEILGNDDDRLFRQNNGYLTADAKQLTAFNKRYSELLAEKSWSEAEVEALMWHKLKIGVHYNAEVTSKDWGEILSKSPEQQITQVFASAAAVGYSRQIERANWKTLAKGILDASYEGVFSVAAQNTTRKVFLTFIGGGVFQNSMTWISDAIYKAAVKYRKYGLTVCLVCYGAVPQGIEPMVKKFNALK